MAKKKLKMCFTLMLADNPVFDIVDDFHPSNGAAFLDAIREFLNKSYEIPVNTNPPVGFQDLAINSFKSVDVDVET